MGGVGPMNHSGSIFDGSDSLLVDRVLEVWFAKGSMTRPCWGVRCAGPSGGSICRSYWWLDPLVVR